MPSALESQASAKVATFDAFKGRFDQELGVAKDSLKRLKSMISD